MGFFDPLIGLKRVLPVSNDAYIQFCVKNNWSNLV